MRTLRAAVFVGPSLRPEDLSALPPEIEILPPAAQGDIYRLSQFRPQAIGLVDGLFHSLPAVWHKEILWAIAKGSTVLGAASMGALRAAELAPFGMRGVGEIFEAYRSGALEDDDEVAVVHGPAELGYLPLTDAMVNIRATLRHGLSEGALDRSLHDLLIDAAKALPFWKRSVDGMFAAAAAAGRPLQPALQNWIVAHKIEQKQQDAQLLVKVLVEMLRDGTFSEKSPNDFAFSHTTMWEHVLQNEVALPDTPLVGIRELVMEIALRGQEFAHAVGIAAILPNEAAPSPAGSACPGVNYPGEPASASLPAESGPAASGRVRADALVAALERAGVYGELRDSAMRKREASRAYGGREPIEDREAAVAAHFDRVPDAVPWFRRRSGDAWRQDRQFWSAFDSYARSLGLRNAAVFVRAVVEARLLHGGRR